VAGPEYHSKINASQIRQILYNFPERTSARIDQVGEDLTRIHQKLLTVLLVPFPQVIVENQQERSF
jgi:hypothetical protein